VIATFRHTFLRSFSLAFFASVLGSGAIAQELATLSARVIDPLGAPIPNARVTLLTRGTGPSRAVVTDNRGVARFDRLPTGDYLLEIEAEGFVRPDPRQVRLSAGEPHEISVQTASIGFEDHVVVTASGTAQNVDELSKAASVVDHLDMERRGDRWIAEALRAVPGVRIQQLGGPGAATSINIRGMRNEDTSVLIDGVRFRDAGATQGDASTFVSDLLLTNPDRVEVLRGSGSSLYGSNAIGGVINVITRSGAGPPAGAVLFEAGGLETWRARAHVGGGVSNDRVSYSAGVTRLDVAQGIDDDDRADNTSAQGELGLSLGGTARLVGRFYGAQASTMVNEGPRGIGPLPATGVVNARPIALAELARYESGTPIADLNPGEATFIPSANDPDNQRESTFRSTLLSVSQQAGRLGYTVSYHDLATSRRFVDGPLGVSGFEPSQPTESHFDGRVRTLSARTDISIGQRQLVTVSYEFERERYINESLATGALPTSTADVTELSHTAFVQDQLSVTSALHVSAALRVQRFSLETPRLTPGDRGPYVGIEFDPPPPAYTGDVSTIYARPGANTRVRAHLGTGYRAPSLFERFGTSFGRRGYSVYGDPRLAPERSLAVDAGIDQELGAGRLRLSATGFSTQLHDVIVFDFSGAISPATDPFGRSSGYRTTDGAVSRGLELQITAMPAPATRVESAYTYANARPRTGGPAELTQAWTMPRHLFSFALVQRLGKPLQVAFDVTVSSAHFAPLSDPVTFASRVFQFAGMRRANLAGIYVVPLSSHARLRLFGRVDDLFGSTYHESGFRTPGRFAMAGAGIEF
jgi:vitamin B12 transporter